MSGAGPFKAFTPEGKPAAGSLSSHRPFVGVSLPIFRADPKTSYESELAAGSLSSVGGGRVRSRAIAGRGGSTAS